MKQLRSKVGVFRREDGQITIMLALLIIILMSFSFKLFQSARAQSEVVLCERNAEISMYSTFSKYDTSLLKEYGVFFLDKELGEGGEVASRKADFSKLEDELFYQNQRNSESEMRFTNFYDINPLDVEVVHYRYATDAAGGVYKRQAIDSIKSKYFLDTIENTLEQWRKWKNSSEETISKVQQKEKEDKEELLTNSENKEVFLEYERESSTSGLQGETKGLLGFIVKEDSQLSDAKIEVNNYPSHRKLWEGNASLTKAVREFSITEEMLFHLYILEKFKCETDYVGESEVELEKGEKQEEEDTLKYQIEYILNGGNSDLENLKATANRLILMREGLNFSYIMSNETMKQEALLAATAIASSLAIPEFITVIQMGLIFLWALAESVLDVQTLLEGGKVPLWKDTDTWKLSVQNVLNKGVMEKSLKDSVPKQETKGKGLDYRQYLMVLLEFGNRKIYPLRSLDIIENQIRSIQKNDNFYMDQCVDWIEMATTYERAQETEIRGVVFSGKIVSVRAYGYGK